MLNKIIKNIKQVYEQTAFKRVCVLVSGGADSALMAEAFEKCKISADFDYVHLYFKNCTVVSPEANKMHLQNLTSSWAKNVKIVEIDVVDLGKGPEGNTRMAMNKWIKSNSRRYDLFALGHNKDDHVETVLIQLFRGAGKGIRGIPDVWCNDFIRPLITLQREQIREYCQDHNIEYFVDVCNTDNTKTRNFLRNEIIPKFIAHYGKGFYKRIDKIAKLSEVVNG